VSDWVEPGADFGTLLTSFIHEAWRWERQGTYRQPEEAEPWARWSRGETDDLEWLNPWLAEVRAATREGRAFKRVRVLDEPLTEYQRWQLDVTPANIAAGEEVRLLFRGQVGQLGLPDHDFWLFDDAAVARMSYDQEQFAGAQLITHPAEVDRYRRWKEVAWHDAVSFAEYVQRQSQRSR
jgi:hypothetical protein